MPARRHDGFLEIRGVRRAPRCPPWARLPRFLDEPPGLRRGLALLKAVLVGVGSVGWAAALHMARLMPAELWIIDRGRLKPESLATHPVGPDRIGQPKARALGQQVKAISPRTRVRVFEGAFEELSLEALLASLGRADVALLAGDNLGLEIAVGAWAQRLGVPLLHGSVDGASLVAQVRSYANDRGAKGACVACAYTREEWAALDAETRFSCVEPRTPDVPWGATTAPAAPLPGTRDTRSTSFLCSLAGDLLVMQLVRRLLAVPEAQGDVMLEYQGHRHATCTSPLPRNPRCRGEHASWTQRMAPVPLARTTPRELFREAADLCGASWRRLGLRVAGHTFVVPHSCTCGTRIEASRFVPERGHAPTCPTCGRSASLPSYYARPEIAGAALEGLLDRPLHQLGAAAVRRVVVRGARVAVVFRSASHHARRRPGEPGAGRSGRALAPCAREAALSCRPRRGGAPVTTPAGASPGRRDP